MTNRDPLKQLEAALSLTPTSDFAARVRRRVAVEPPRRAFFAGGWTVMASVAAAGIVVAIGIAVVSQDRAHDVAGSTPEGGVAPAVALDVAPPLLADGAPVVRPEPRGRRVRPTQAIARASGDGYPGVDQVLVPPDQRVALERLLLAVKAGRAVVPRDSAVVEVDEAGSPMAPRMLEITPIKIEPLAGAPAENIKGALR